MKHNFDSNAAYDRLPLDGYIPPKPPVEEKPAYNLEDQSPPHVVDKSKSISQMTDAELQDLIRRLREESTAQDIIRRLQVNAGMEGDFNNPLVVDTTTPINQLYHYGILGQKWGVRRFQNKDGTRTSAGKKREGNRHGGEKEKPLSKDHMKSRAAKDKGTEGLSNDELKKLNERLQLEETYKRLTAEKMERSESWVKESLSNAGKQALTEFSKGVFLGSAKLLVKEISPQLAEAAFNVKEKKKD